MEFEFSSQKLSGAIETGKSAFAESVDAIKSYAADGTAVFTNVTNQYDVSGLSYPDDLLNNPAYGQNRVIFYINVSVDSRVLKNGTADVAVVEGVQRNFRGQLVGQNISTAAAMGVAGVAGALGGTALGSMIGAGGTGGLLGAGLGVGGTAVIADQANNAEVPEGQKKEPTFTRPQKRLKTAIALYIPNQLNTRYSVGWGEEDTFMFSALTKLGSEGAAAIARAFGSPGSETRATGVAGEVLGALATTGVTPFGKEQGIAAGLAQNPKKEQAFKNVDFRTFTFEYNFAPKSSAEAQNVLNIIRQFKYHMHPEFKSEDAFLYIYPSEFDIVYYHGAKENLNIHRHTSCVLTEMNVNYTPNGVFTTFSDGMPTQINVTLTFKELMLLSKELIEQNL